MADYQYQPDMSDPVAKLKVAMDNMDGMPVNFARKIILTRHATVDTIMRFRMPTENEDYDVPISYLDPQLADQEDSAQVSRSNLRLFPPPVFSRQSIPQTYK